MSSTSAGVAPLAVKMLSAYLLHSPAPSKKSGMRELLHTHTHKNKGFGEKKRVEKKSNECKNWKHTHTNTQHSTATRANNHLPPPPLTHQKNQFLSNTALPLKLSSTKLAKGATCSRVGTDPLL